MKQTCGSCKYRPLSRGKCIYEDSPKHGRHVSHSEPPCYYWTKDVDIIDGMFSGGRKKFRLKKP